MSVNSFSWGLGSTLLSGSLDHPSHVASEFLNAENRNDIKTAVLEIVTFNAE